MLGMPRLPKGDASRERGCVSQAVLLQAVLRARRSSAAPTCCRGRRTLPGGPWGWHSLSVDGRRWGGRNQWGNGCCRTQGSRVPSCATEGNKGRCFSLKEPKYLFSYDCRSHFKPYLGEKASPSASHSALPTQHRPCPVFPCALNGGWQLSRLSWGWLRSISMCLAAGTFHFISSHA